MGKRFVTEVRERKHGLFSEMVTSIAKDVMKNPDLQANFMEGTSINVGKIVDVSFHSAVVDRISVESYSSHSIYRNTDAMLY